jgi:hypothetical protein
MFHQFARLIMLFSIFNMVFMTSAPAFATKKAPEPNLRKIERCVQAVTKEAKKLGKKLSPILGEAALRTCWVTEDSQAGVPILHSVSSVAISKAIQKINTLQVQQGFKGKARKEEPGLLGLDGAKEVLSDLLKKEAVALWALSDAVGYSADAFSKKSKKETRGFKGPQKQVKVSTNLESIKTTDVPNDSAKSSDTIKITNYQHTEENNDKASYVDQYVKVHMQSLEGDPDTAFALKMRMFNVLKKLALTSPKQHSDAEKRYLASFESYVREQYVYMIDAAIQKHNEWKAEQAEKQDRSLAGKYAGSLRAAPPDFYDEMGAALVLGAYAGATAAMIAGAASFKASVATAVTAAVAQVNTAGMSAGAADGAIAEATNAAIAEASLGGGVATGGVAVTVGPALIIVAAVLTGILGTKALVQGANLEKKLDRLKDWQKNGSIHAKTLLSTREGTMQFTHFYAKATSSSSPGVAGYINPADGCRACFYAEKNYEGEMVCTDKTFNDLKTATQDGTVVKMNKKISSVALDQTTCQNSFAVLYDGTKFRGDRKILRSSVSDLSVFSRDKKSWDDAAKSVAFSNKDAPQCEVCVYTKTGFEGAKACLSEGGVGRLSAMGLADKISSVQFNTESCAKGKLWLYKKNDFVRKANGSGVTEISESTSDLGKGVRNTASSLFFAASGVNPHEKPASGGCRACLYDRPNHKGEYMCVDKTIPDMSKFKMAGEFYNFNNMASSVQFIRDNCQKNESLELEVFTKTNFGGKVYRFFGTDMMDLSRLGTNMAHLDGVANNVASSVKFDHYDKAKSCQLCLYTESNYQGEKHCVKADAASFASNLNNSISSLRLEKGACSGGGALIFGNKNYGGKNQEITRSYPDLSVLKRGNGNWNNALSSVKFAPNYAELKAQALENVQKLVAQTKPKPVDPATLCEICVYKDKNFKGEKQCISGKASSFSGSLNNSISSVKVFKGACPKGGATLYKDKNYGGKSAFILNSDPDLTSVAGSSLNWNNNMSSLKFSDHQRDSMVEAFKKLFRNMNEKQINAQITKTFGN